MATLVDEFTTLLAMPTHFGTWLKAARLRRGWSQDRLADAVGISKTQISRIEAGHQGTRKPTVARFAEALGADAREALNAFVQDTPGLEDEITYQQDIDSLPIPEGYRDLDEPYREFVNESLRVAVEQALRLQRRNNIGYRPDDEEDQQENDEDADDRPFD